MTPDEFTNAEHFLDVGDGHQLYVQDWGNPSAKTPIIFLHGGPGDQSKDKHKDAYDPKLQRVIFFDQRGCGRSLPYGSLDHNTTNNLVSDISKVADSLDIKQFILVGGSWGSSLALFYGIRHPERVQAMVLNGIWTCRKNENDWVDKGGFRTFLPEVWERYVASVPQAHADDPSAYHFKRILGNNPDEISESALAYTNMEAAAIRLDDRFVPEITAELDPAGVRIEVHYFANQCFVPEGYIFDHTHKLTMPIYLIQGRYDLLCPPVTAYELHQKLPNSELMWSIAGHKTEHESWNLVRSTLRHLTK